MDFINFHIAYLLTKHECVVIPDFGAFVVSKAKEAGSKNRGFISPPANRSLTFNPEIIQDDKLLAGSIAKEKSISYREALRLVHDYVDSLVDELRKGQVVQFPWIGKIHLSGDRKIVFTPAKNLSCNAANCGLANLNFPYLSEAVEDEFTEKRKKTRKRPAFYILLAIIVLLLAALFIFLFPNPLDKNWFSFPDPPDISTIFRASPPPAVTDTVPAIKTNPVKPKITDSVKPVSTEYFIIVSSMATEKEAEVMLKYFLAKGLDKAQIIRSDGKYRISIETFGDREEALSFLDMIRKDGGNPLFKDAWIFEASH